jgi:hypothetical protein
MKRNVLSGLSLVSLALSLGLAGCGGGGMEEGVPKDIPGDTTSNLTISLKADMVGATKKMKKAAADRAAEAKRKPTPSAKE